MLQEYKDKMKDTCFTKYGNYYVATQDRIDKTREWCRRHYDCDWHTKTEECKNKTYKTCIERYGEYTPLKSEAIKEKIRSTCIKKYGSDWITKTESFKEKSRKTCMKKYDVEYWVKTSKFKEMSLKTCEDNWNSPYYLTSDDCKNKQKIAREKNSKYLISKFEIDAGNLLSSIFSDVRGQYKSDEYPFNCDFYIGEIDTYIELNGMWVHGKHEFDQSNKNDISILNEWKKKSISSSYYKRAIEIWTVSDVKKRTWAKEHELKFKEFWNIEELKLWIKSINL